MTPATDVPTVRPLHPRTHLPAVLELEQAASADRRRIYEGTPWTAGGFREFLRAPARGIVALNRAGTVVGFAVFAPADGAIVVPKLVFQSRAAEDALLRALWAVLNELRKSVLHLPMILDLE